MKYMWGIPRTQVYVNKDDTGEYQQIDTVSTKNTEDESCMLGGHIGYQFIQHVENQCKLCTEDKK